MQIAANAMNMTTAEFGKLVESGQLTSAEFLPKFGKALREAANGTGALEDKLKTTRVAQGRFNKELETGQDIAFRGGFDEGGAELFNTLSDQLRDSSQGLKSFGAMFRAIFKTIAAVSKIIIPVVEDIASIIANLTTALEKVFGSGVGKWVLGIGLITAAMRKLQWQTQKTFLKFTAIFGVLTELIALFTSGYVGTVEGMLGKDINLSNLKGDESTVLGKIYNVLLDMLPLLTAIASAVWIFGILGAIFSKTFSLLSMISRALGLSKDKKPTTGTKANTSTKPTVASTASTVAKATASKLIMPITIGTAAWDAFSGLKDKWEGNSSTMQMIRAASQKRENQVGQQTVINGDVNPTIHIPSGDPDVIKRTMDDWFNSITINNAAAGG